MKDLSTSCVLAFAFVHRFAFAFVHRFALSTRIRGSEDCELVSLGSLDPRRCSCDLLWSRPFVASWDLLWSLGSSQSFCGLCLKIVVRDSISAQKEINSGR